MEKINVVLVMLNENALRSTLQSLNFTKVSIVAVMIENGSGKFLTLDNEIIPLISFSYIQNVLNISEKLLWLIGGKVHAVSDVYRTKKFLINSGVPEENIINFELSISPQWIANLRYIEKYGADFFATGISYTEVGLDLNFIPHVKGRGVNLASTNQDLRQSYLTAKYIFEHVKPGTIKFVLIGLAPYSFRYDNAKDFSVTTQHLQYMFALDASERNIHDRLLKNLVSDNVKNLFKAITAEQADLNFQDIKMSNGNELSTETLTNWEDELNNLTKTFYPDTVAENFQILKDYIKLCLHNGAKPIGVIFPFAPIIRKKYNGELLTQFRSAIRQLQENYDFTCIDFFKLNLSYDCFYNLSQLNLNGAATASNFVALKLYSKNLLPIENFCNMNYDYFETMSRIVPKNIYNSLLESVFKVSAQKIRRKNKIKLAFVIRTTAEWSGDDLYSYFVADRRFEVTIFLCLPTDETNVELVRKDFRRGIEQFKSHGLNVVGLSDINDEAPAQDVLIFLTPYIKALPNVFRFDRLTAKTLIIYFPYFFNTAKYDAYNFAIMHIAWKIFFESPLTLDIYDKKCFTGMPRAYFSGYPKLDILYNKRDSLQFKWKMARPNAKKIIYAPHWSINNGVNYATFQWNYEFMYKFAKAHPEISWVVKPHPNLLFSAVDAGVFPSAAAFNEYLQKWDALPNAQVYTGAYYQAIFATSDGMIHDSSSFIAEYQYVQKPMIFLTREDTTRNLQENFNELGELIMSVSYLVDGEDLNGIAALIKKIFIEGNDYKAAARREVFDKYLNYPKYNGMSASEFIYRRIESGLFPEAT